MAPKDPSGVASRTTLSGVKPFRLDWLWMYELGNDSSVSYSPLAFAVPFDQSQRSFWQFFSAQREAALGPTSRRPTRRVSLLPLPPMRRPMLRTRPSTKNCHSRRTHRSLDLAPKLPCTCGPSSAVRTFCTCTPASSSWPIPASRRRRERVSC